MHSEAQARTAPFDCNIFKHICGAPDLASRAAAQLSIAANSEPCRCENFKPQSAFDAIDIIALNALSVSVLACFIPE